MFLAESDIFMISPGFKIVPSSPLSSSVVQGVTVSYKLEIVLPSYRVNPAALDLSNSYSSNTTRANDLVNSQVISFTSITPSQITTSGNSKIITLNSTQRSSTGFTELKAAFDNGYIGDGPNFDNDIATDLVWVLEPEGSTANLASEKTSIPKEYRIINIEEKEGGTHGISAVDRVSLDIVVSNQGLILDIAMLSLALVVEGVPNLFTE